MARTLRSAPWGEAVNEEHPLNSLNWVRETTITAGSHSQESYKANHTAAKGLQFRILPALGDGTPNERNATTTPNTEVARIVSYASHMFDALPLDPIIILQASVNANPSNKYAVYYEVQTNGDLQIIAGDGSTVLGTIPGAFAAGRWVSLMFTQEKTAATTIRERVWAVPANARSWGDPLFDHNDATLISITGFALHEVDSYNARNVTIPGMNHYLDDGDQYQFDTDADLLPGPYKLSRLTPDGNGSFTQFDEGTGTFDYQEVDEAPANDADYTQSDTGASGLKHETYTHTDFAGPANAIIQDVTVNARVKCNGGGSARVDIVDGGTRTNSGVNVLNAAFVNCPWRHFTPPSSGGVWTIPKVNALEGGAFKATTPTAQNVQLSRVFIDVGFTIPGSLVAPNRAAQRARVAR